MTVRAHITLTTKACSTRLCERTSHFCDPSVICGRHSCDMAMSLAHQFVPRPMAATADLAYGVATVEETMQG